MSFLLSTFQRYSSVILICVVRKSVRNIYRADHGPFFYLSNFHFLSIKFLAGLPNTLNQDHNSRLTTIWIFLINYKLSWSFLASKGTDFYFIRTPPVPLSLPLFIAKSLDCPISFKMVHLQCSPAKFYQLRLPQILAFLTLNIFCYSGKKTSEYIIFLWIVFMA